MITRIRFPPKKRGHRTHLSFRMFYSFFGPEIAPLSFVASLYQSPDEIGPKSNAPNTEILRVVVLEKGHLHKGTRSTNFPAMFLMRGSLACLLLKLDNRGATFSIIYCQSESGRGQIGKATERSLYFRAMRFARRKIQTEDLPAF